MSFTESFGGTGSLPNCFPVSLTQPHMSTRSWLVLTGPSALEFVWDSSWKTQSALGHGWLFCGLLELWPV